MRAHDWFLLGIEAAIALKLGDWRRWDELRDLYLQARATQ